MATNTNLKKKSIIGHTTTCTYCGHRILPENLNAHISRIHPGEEGDNKFTGSLKKTKPNSWWEKAAELNDGMSLGTVFSEVVREPDPKNRVRKRIRLISGPEGPVPNNCIICGIRVESNLLKSHINDHINIDASLKEDELFCPICSLILKSSAFKPHLKQVHRHLSGSEINALYKKTMFEDFYGMTVVAPVNSLVGRIMVSNRGWLKCPTCQSIIRLTSLMKHYFSFHGLDLTKKTRSA